MSSTGRFPAAELPPDPIPQKFRRGVRVVVAAQIGSQLVTVVVLSVLYRQLGPGPYGLLGMVMPLLLLLRIGIAGGLDVASVQQDQLSDQQASVLFWFNQVLGAAMILAAVALAPALAWFYRAAAVVPLTIALSGTSLPLALSTQHQALLQRRLRLGTLALIRLAAQIGGGIAAIATALAHGGVWALVVQQYVEVILVALAAWWAEPWRPQWMLRRAGIRPLVRFGGYYTLSSLMFYLTTNVDKILIGRFLKEDALGLYSQAFNLMMKPVNVVIAPLTGVMLPALSRAAGDPQRYVELLLGFFRWIALVMFPIGVGLIIVADDAMQVLGGSRWSGAGPLLAALGGSVLVQGFFNVLGSVLASVGRAKHLFYASAAIAATLAAAFCVGLWVGMWAGAPTLGVAASYSVAMVVLVFPPYMALCLRAVGASLRAWLAQLLPAALAAAGMGLAVAACHALLAPHGAVPVLARLAAEIAVGVMVYAILAWREIRWFLRLGRT